MKQNEVECVVDAKALVGEGTVWDPRAQCLWWIDIWGRKIHRYELSSESTQTFETPGPPGCLAVRQRGGLVLAMLDGFYFFDPARQEFQHVVDAEPHLKETRMNDGKTDRQGRFWSGTVFEVQGVTSRAIGALYRLDADLSCHKVVDGVACSNGLAWSPDGRTMYFSDSCTPYVWAWDFEGETGKVRNRRVFIDLTSVNGACDGATVDAEGCYWLTLPLKGQVQRYDPAGRLMQTIKLPTDAPTCCEFGGKDLDILYVTTSTLRRTPLQLKGQPLAGGLFAVDVGVRGLPGSEFLG
jgi:sugar lactone lactonase YvrE